VLQYYARHFFAPLLVSSLETTDGEVEVWVTSDLASTLSLTLTVQLWTWHGKQIGQWHESLKAEPHCSKAVWKRKVKDLLKTVLLPGWPHWSAHIKHLIFVALGGCV
jgi:hypothetical protein